MRKNQSPAQRVEIFARYIKRNGKIIYPKNAKFFHFWIEK